MRSLSNVSGAFGESLLRNQLQRFKRLPVLMLCLVCVSLTVIAAPSDLDPTFGIGGKVVSNPNDSPSSIRGNGMALQSDGKIVMVGGADTSGANFIVVRYAANGSLDTTFDGDGWVSVNFGGNERAVSVAIQTDGKIVVAGMTYTPSQNAAIARLNSDGSLDTTFSGDGKTTVDFVDTFGSYPDYINVVKIAGDGKIVFAGGALGTGLSYQSIVGRLNPDGSPDLTFAGDGTLMNGGGVWDDLVIQADGSVVLVGGASGQFFSSMKTVKYNNFGISDWSYGKNVTPGCYIGLNGIAALPDGKFVVVGTYGCKMIATRLNANGAEDNTFVNASTPNGEAYSVAIQPDGKIVANISFDGNGNGGFSLIRYNANGSLDLGFGNSGIVVTGVGDPSSLDAAKKVIIQPDEKILVGGAARTEAYRFAMVRYQGGASVPLKTLFDYDGDGKADVSVFRPSEDRWYVLRSSDSGLTQPFFGTAGDIPTPADFNGDGKTDIAIFRPSSGDWWYLDSITSVFTGMHWGSNGDIPLPSDVDGDGKADYVVYHPANNYWYRLTSGTGQVSEKYFGAAGDKPLIGDFDGDGKADPAIFRPSTGVFWYMSSIDSVHRAIQWGTSTDIPVPADYDGDRKTDAAVYRPSTGAWYIFNSSNGSVTSMNFGISEDKPVAADYDGDGRADIGVFRPSTGTWYLQGTTAGFGSVQWGAATDIPTENAFIP